MQDMADAVMASPIDGQLDQDVGSPGFGGEPIELLNMLSKMEDKDISKQIFGEKTFDFAADIGDAPMEIELAIPKDLRKKQNFQKMIMLADQGLDGKVNKLKANMKHKLETQGEDFLTEKIRTLQIDDSRDPLQDILQLTEKPFKYGDKNRDITLA